MTRAVGKREQDILERILTEFREHSESEGCLLCDEAGYVILQQELDDFDPMVVAALGAGVFAASRELARRLGETQFSDVVHQGTSRGICICAVTAGMLFMSVFTSQTNLGLVRLCMRSAADALRSAVELAGPVESAPLRLKQDGAVFAPADSQK